ncbi:MAG: hypothetical protein PF795_11800 [Kiritimatiellae bacterium]|jgi:hypothetical protein|nr:hypothetical protein [Kiritimatiellia bacterium]
MAIRIRNLSFALATLLLIQPPTRGQEGEVTLRELNFYVASGSRIRNVRFGVFDKAGLLVRSKPTGFRTSGRSLNYRYEGPNPLEFFEEEAAPTPSKPDAVRRTPVGRIMLPPDVDEVMFFFAPKPDFPDSGLKYTVTGIDIRTETVPAGHITIFNTLPVTFRGVVGKSKNRKNGEQLQIDPGINTPIDIHPQAQILLALESESEGFLRVYEDTIQCGDSERVLLILFPPRFPGSLNVGGKLISFPIRAEAAEESSDP